MPKPRQGFPGGVSSAGAHPPSPRLRRPLPRHVRPSPRCGDPEPALVHRRVLPGHPHPRRLDAQRRGPRPELHHPVRRLRPDQLRDVLREPPQHPEAPLRGLARGALRRARAPLVRTPTPSRTAAPGAAAARPARSRRPLSSPRSPRRTGRRPRTPPRAAAPDTPRRATPPSTPVRSSSGSAAPATTPTAVPVRSGPARPAVSRRGRARYQAAVSRAPCSTHRYSSSRRSRGLTPVAEGEGAGRRGPRAAAR